MVRIWQHVIFLLLLAGLTASCPRWVAAQGTAHASCDSLVPADGSTWDAWAPEFYRFIDLHTTGQKVSISGGFANTDYIATWTLLLCLSGTTKDGDPTAGAKFKLDGMGNWTHLAKGTGELDDYERFYSGRYQVQAYTNLSASVFNGADLNPHPATDNLIHTFTVQNRQ